MYSLDCSYFDKEFVSLEELQNYCEIQGMDPNYEITKDNKLTGVMLIDLIVM